MKKAISPVIATALLLVMTVVAIVGFNSWFSMYQTKTLSGVEVNSQNSGGLEIDTIIGNTLYIRNPTSNNLSLTAVRIGSKTCTINKYYSKGFYAIDLSSCLNVSNGVNDVLIISNSSIREKKVFVKSGIGSSSLVVVDSCSGLSSYTPPVSNTLGNDLGITNFPWGGIYCGINANCGASSAMTWPLYTATPYSMTYTPPVITQSPYLNCTSLDYTFSGSKVVSLPGFTKRWNYVVRIVKPKGSYTFTIYRNASFPAGSATLNWGTTYVDVINGSVSSIPYPGMGINSTIRLTVSASSRRETCCGAYFDTNSFISLNLAFIRNP